MPSKGAQRSERFPEMRANQAITPRDLTGFRDGLNLVPAAAGHARLAGTAALLC
jgi:hypothetical protein